MHNITEANTKRKILPHPVITDKALTYPKCQGKGPKRF